jgi:radical SAM enzyme (TIGR01210 family)
VTAAPYPEQAAARRRWIEERRGPRNQIDPWRPHAFFIEQECSQSRAVVPVLTIFLTNRECPWRCVMCDLWKNTTTETAARGAISAQIDFAIQNVDSLEAASYIKLYNSGSFFDHGAVPPASYGEIAARLSEFNRVIVECHPRLVSDEVLRFRDLLGTELEVAMGLETANPDVLARLNKGMTLEDFAGAAKFLTRNGIAVRAFVLLKPPWTSEEEGVVWAKRSIDFAFGCGVEVVSVIPTRPGNGALDALAARGEFVPPRLDSLEEVIDYGITFNVGRILADLWDVQRFSDCPKCFTARKERLHAINLSQHARARVNCANCER